MEQIDNYMMPFGSIVSRMAFVIYAQKAILKARTFLKYEPLARRSRLSLIIICVVYEKTYLSGTGYTQ